MVGMSYSPDVKVAPWKGHDKARNAAFCLVNAAEHLRKYAILMEEGIERPINIELAINNINFALNSLDAYATYHYAPYEMHKIMKDIREIGNSDDRWVESR
jgi:hypothetical protein